MVKERHIIGDIENYTGPHTVIGYIKGQGTEIEIDVPEKLPKLSTRMLLERIAVKLQVDIKP